MRNEMQYLGCRVKEKVTGLSGIVTSLCFDLYGCVQGLVHPGLDKDGKPAEQHWFDLKRLTVENADPVMPRPDFADVPGGQDKPAQREIPRP